MKKQVLFVQGGGDGAYREDARLVENLREALGPDYQVRYPEMPNEDEPDYGAWTARIAQELAGIGDGAIIVGHSIGASVVIKCLVEGDINQSLAGVLLIAAPFWHDHEIWQWKDVELPEDATARLPKGLPIYLYHSREDEIVPFAHVDLYAKLLPRVAVRRLSGRNHQLNDDLSEVAADMKRLVQA